VQSSGSALLIAGDANNWFESGAVGYLGKVLIQNNIFDNNLTNSYQFCQAVISIDPEIPQLADKNSDAMYHRNIVIKNNTINAFDVPILYAKSVKGLSFSDNKITYNQDFEDWHNNRAIFTFDASREVTINNNTFEGDKPQDFLALERMNSSEVTGNNVPKGSH
jgi:hypothetical protein